MARLFVASQDLGSGPLTLTGEAHRYLTRVLRLGVGDRVDLFDGLVLEGPRVRLEIIRGDLAAVRRLLGEDDVFAKRRTGYHLGRISIRLDALAALRDRVRLEDEAPRFLRPGTYLEPFALRALGIVRADETLVQQAQACFRALGLEWHAAQTDGPLRTAVR